MLALYHPEPAAAAAGRFESEIALLLSPAPIHNAGLEDSYGQIGNVLLVRTVAADGSNHLNSTKLSACSTLHSILKIRLCPGLPSVKCPPNH